MDDQPAAPAVAPTPAAPARESKEILKSSDFYVMVGVLAGVLLLAALAITIVDRWRRRQAGDRGTSSPLTLSAFREMYENGEITQKEYERIRAKMAAKMKKEVGLGAPAAPPPAAPPADGAVGTDDTPPPADPPPAK